MVATIIDVAKKCGYSKATVSRAFASPEAVSERAKARIYAAANELNYTPNPIARAMARQKTDNITCHSESVLFVGFGSDHAGNDETELWPFCHYK